MNSQHDADIGVCPDLHSSTVEYAARFAGATGAWLIDAQTRALLSLVAPRNPASIIDIGGGHAQCLTPLLDHGFKPQIYSSSSDALGLSSSLVASKKVMAHFGSLETIQLPDKEYQAVISLRILSHMRDWTRFIAELCRISSRDVIIDYATFQSFNLLAGALFHLKKLIEGNTRHFLTFWDSQLDQEFAKYGFKRAAEVRLLFWPLGLHRALKNVQLSSRLETFADLASLRNTLGSPVIVRFERRDHSSILKKSAAI